MMMRRPAILTAVAAAAVTLIVLASLVIAFAAPEQEAVPATLPGGVAADAAASAPDAPSSTAAATPTTKGTQPATSPPPSNPTTLPPADTTTIAPSSPTTPPPAGVQFIETFDSPTSLERFRWELADGRPPYAIDGFTWQADHDLECQGVDTSRTITGPALSAGTRADWTVDDIPTYWDAVDGQVVYWCREHVMTTYNTEGYAHIDFSPDQVFEDVERICWDMNGTDLGGRKWVDMTVVPEAHYQQHGGRLDYVNPGFAPDGPGFWGLPVEAGIAMLTVQQGRVVGHGSLSGDAYGVMVGNTDKMARLSTCVDATGVVEQELPDGTLRVTDLEGSLPSGPVRVIFADVSYNPDKAVGESPPAVAAPYTWHWDNIIIS